jgi:hypothetical protein
MPLQPTADKKSGLRDNLATEALTFSVDGSKLYSGMENALYQDGPAATLVSSSPSRISEFDAYLLGKPLREFVYMVAPVPDAPVPATSFATNGLVEL